MRLLVLGANSDIAYAAAKIFSKLEKADLILASRDLELLGKKVLDAKARYDVATKAVAFDATDYDSHKAFYESLDPKPDGVIVAFGYLGDQTSAQKEFSEAKTIISSNYVGAVSIIEIIANDFEKRNKGFIIGISSVAGLRGRQSNYMYGSAKGGLAIYLQGLRNRLSKKGILVLTVFPGFVRTKMTQGLELPERLLADPDIIAADIYRAYKKNKNIVYTKWFWRWIMWIIRLIPESVFKKMNL